VAIAATYVITNLAVPTSSTVLYTTPASTVQTYIRDLILTNSGTTTIFLSLGTGASSAATTSSFVVPTGGSVVLTECTVPNTAIIYGVSPTNAGALNIGYGSVVSVT
jgi:hypothetical protein